MPEVTDMEQVTLDATHRCDRCGAQAYVVTRHEAEHLFWCVHHYRRHEEKLAGSKVLDERASINVSPSVSAY